MTRWLLLALLAAPTAQGQAVRLHVLADSVRLGEPFEVAVAVDHAPGTVAVFPTLPAGDPERAPLLPFGEAEILDARRLPPVERRGLRTDSVVFTAAAFRLDSARVGPLTVGLARGADTLALRSPSAVLRIVQTAPDSAALPPHLPPAPFPFDWAPWAAGALGLAALALLFMAWPRRTKRLPEPLLPPLEPYAEALARLDALEKAPATPEAIEAHYVELAALVRQYASRALGLPAPEWTTAELLLALRADARVLPAALLPLADALGTADLVKFADARPGLEAHAHARSAAREGLGLIEGALHPPAPVEARAL